jgi:hypothetical protein
MRPTWLIEANVEGLSSGPIREEARRQGLDCHVVKFLPALSPPKDIAGAESLPMDAFVIFRGTLPLMRHIQATRRWRPGGWCDFRNLACSTYYAHFGPYLLNADYALLPIAEAVRLANVLLARHGVAGEVFVRPDSVGKNFTGTVTDRATLTHKFQGAGFDPETMVLMARPKKVGREWRLVVVNGKVIAGSQYRNAHEVEESPGCPEEALRFAATVLERVNWRPAPAFVMDVCESEDGLRVLELGSFGCSGHYAADVAVVVRAASELAAACW